MAAALLPLVASGATAIGATGVATAATGLGAFMAGTGGTLLSGALTAASAFGSIMGGSQQNAAYKAQAKQYELSARQEELKGRDQADKIRRSLQATLATQRAAWGARGVSSTGGTPVNLAAQSSNDASYDIQLAQFGAGMAAGADRGNGAQARISGSAAKMKGYTDAASRIGGSLI